MLRVAALVAIVAACACGGPDRRLDAAFEGATQALRRGDLTQAQSLAAAGLASAARAADTEWPWKFRVLHSEILLAKRDPDQASQLTIAAVPAGSRFDAIRLRIQYLQARVEYLRGRLPQALAIIDKAGDSGHEGTGTALEMGAFAGQLRIQLGQWDEGQAELNTVIERAARADDRYAEALALNVMGMGRTVRSRFDEALPWFERLLALRDLQETALYSRALYNAGLCYARLGLFERAAAYQERAVKAYQKREVSADYEQALGQLGNTYVLQNRPAEGLPYIKQALDVARQANLAADATLWAGNLASAYTAIGQWDAADRFNQEAQRLWAATQSGKPVYNTLNSAAIAAGRLRHQEAIRLFEDALATPDAPPSVVWDAHAGVASAAIALGKPDLAGRHFDAALAVIERTRSGLLKTDYKVSYLAQLISFYQQYVDVLVAQGRIERALEIADSSRGRVLAERQGGAAPARISAAQFVERARQSRSVFLSYWLTPGRSFLWVVSGSGVKCLPLPPEAEIQALVRDHQAGIANVLAHPLGAAGTAGDTLYRLLLQPVAAMLPPGTPIVIVPDGALHAVNFETLPVDGSRRHFWIEDAEIQIAPSLAALTMKTAPATADRSLLLIGNPAPRAPEFPALSYAPIEMTNVARHFGAGQVETFDGVRASPEAYDSARPERFGFVHFTAHATASLESPLDSAVILSGPDSAFKLYARDVATRPLQAEVVTVSACRSAGERAYSGEGLIGFSWAFLRAGARRVIAGLWDVDDRSTADLMDKLYANLAAGDPAPRALRRAKLALIAQGGSSARPYNWGPFEVFTVTP